MAATYNQQLLDNRGAFTTASEIHSVNHVVSINTQRCCRIPDPCCFGQNTIQEEYRSRSKQRIALSLLLVCHFVTWSGGRIMVEWFPKIVDTRGTYDFVAPLQVAMFFSIAWISGLITDAFINRKTALIGSVTVGSAVLCACLAIMKYEKVDQSGHTDSDRSALDARPTTGSASFSKLELREPFTGVFFVLLMVGYFIMSMATVTLPTLGGDQFADRHGVRNFYAAFYFTRVLSDILTCGYTIALVINAVQDITLWVVLAPICAGVVLILSIIVSCKTLTRQVQANTSVLTHGGGMFLQALRRRGQNGTDGHFLANAARSNGGDYPDEEVKERINMLKFALVILLLIPTSLLATIMAFMEISYNDKTHCNQTSGAQIPIPDRYGIEATNYMILYPTSAVFVILLYGVQYVLISTGRLQERDRPSFLTKFIFGYIFSILTSCAVLVGYYLEVCSDGYQILPYILIGMANAIINSTGYELTFISAPRSLQGTAMGMFYLVQGAGQVLFLIIASSIPTLSNTSSSKWLFMGVGVGANGIGLISMIIANKTLDLGLGIP